MPIDFRAAQQEEANRRLAQVKYDAAAAADVRTHYQSVDPAVKIPAFQAIITGIFMGISAGLLTSGLTMAVYWVAMGLSFTAVAVSGGVFVAVFLITWGVVQAVVWVFLLRDWRALVWKIEVALGLDLNQDGQVGQLPAKSIKIETLQRTRTGAQTMLFDTPGGDWAKFVVLCQALYNNDAYGVKFTEERWGGADRLYSQPKFRQVQDKFIEAGWAARRNPNQENSEIILTAKGKAHVKYFALHPQEPAQEESYEIVAR